MAADDFSLIGIFILAGSVGQDRPAQIRLTRPVGLNHDLKQERVRWTMIPAGWFKMEPPLRV
jgi:hypothetical protein